MVEPMVEQASTLGTVTEGSPAAERIVEPVVEHASTLGTVTEQSPAAERMVVEPVVEQASTFAAFAYEPTDECESSVRVRLLKSGSGYLTKEPKLSLAEVEHMLLFFVCQLRAEYAEVVSDGGERCGSSRRPAYEAFDAEMARIGGAMNVAVWEPKMRSFLLGNCARGDKWMPWHAALGAHEMYLLQVVYRLPRLATARDRHVLGYAFSGSRDIELFEALLRPLFEDSAADDDAELGRLVLREPTQAFARDGLLHNRYFEYRRRGKRLHTTSYSCHPPLGSSGDEFVYYILDRTRRFVELGHKAFDVVQAALDGRARRGAVLRGELEATLLANYEIGPTMTKMFSVTTHIAHPHLGLLDDECPVGDGANKAFDFLFPGLDTHHTKKSRASLFARLYEHLASGRAGEVFARFEHMLRWTAEQATARFSPDVVPAAALSSNLTCHDLQVNLCEWRKFRTHVDTHRSLVEGTPHDRPRTPPKKKKKRRKHSAFFPSSPAIAPSAVAELSQDD